MPGAGKLGPAKTLAQLELVNKVPPIDNAAASCKNFLLEFIILYFK
jgi:hypothetical protein